MHSRHPSHSWQRRWRHADEESGERRTAPHPARGFAGEYDEADECSFDEGVEVCRNPLHFDWHRHPHPFYSSNRVRGSDSAGYGSEDGSRGVAAPVDRQGTGRDYGDPNAFSGGYDRAEAWSYGEGALGHAGKGPKGYQRSKERIHEEVCETLARHPEIDASDVEVAVGPDNSVSLDGTVPDRHSKRLAERAIERISGVSDVINRLSIQK